MDHRKASQRKPREAPFYITTHAQQRFQERFAPGFTLAQALREAKALATQAERTDQRTLSGDEIWISGEVRFLVRREKRGLTCITIFPKDTDLDNWIEDLT